ncbi:hypothetical protein [Leucobacter luti]|nr:hypothetical protein [Leucobacter luti]
MPEQNSHRGDTPDASESRARVMEAAVSGEVTGDTADISTLASLLEQESEALFGETEGQLLPALIRAASKHLRGLVVDRDALMQTRHWEEHVGADIGPLPDRDDTAALRSELRACVGRGDELTAAKTVLDARALLSHVEWYSSIRNFVVLHRAQENAAWEEAHDARVKGLSGILTQRAVQRLIEEQESGHLILADDLRWALEAGDRLRGDSKDLNPPLTKRANSRTTAPNQENV